MHFSGTAFRGYPVRQADRRSRGRIDETVLDIMKEFKLSAWPELSAPYHRTAYRRMLCDMSHRYVTFQHLAGVSGIGKQEVRDFIGMLGEHGILLERDCLENDSIFDSLKPLGGWIYRALTTEIGKH